MIRNGSTLAVRFQVVYGRVPLLLSRVHLLCEQKPCRFGFGPLVFTHQWIIGGPDPGAILVGYGVLKGHTATI